MKGLKELLSAIHARQFAPLYLLGGEEPHHLDQLSDAMESSVLEEHERDFNQTVLYGRDSDLDQILAAARQFPMMAERRLVLVKEAQELREWRSKEKLEKLAAYADNPVASTVLVLVHRNKMPDKRLAAVKRIQKAGVVFQSDRIRDYKLPDWIEGYVTASKRRISPRTSQILAEYLGNDLKKIAGEMDKLFIALPEGGEVSDALIEQHIGISKEYNIFELTNALAEKDVARVTRIVQYMRANEKNHPVPRILPTLTNYFARILTFHHLPSHDPSAVASALRVHPFAAKEYARAARNYPARKVARIFGYLRECDARSKGINNATVAPYDLLEEALFKTLH
ncbi:MAG: DNA polymerase III subunit delta [Flavobacteriales bacterium]|nr:DNA polymerase III subunit delta [Flavobacteriales bacterium]